MLKYFLKGCAVIFLSLLLAGNNSWAGITLDGTDDFITCGTADILQEDGTFTISAWINISTLPAISARIVQRGTSGDASSGMHYQINSDGTFGLAIFGSTDKESYSVETLSTNTWYSLVVTNGGGLTASNIHLYVNNVEVTYTDQFDGVSLNDTLNGLVNIGRRGDGARYLNGSITEVAIWNVVLTAGEIANLSSSKLRGMPLMIQPTALKLYLPMNEGVAGFSADLDTAWDLSGNGNNGNPDNGADNLGCAWAAETVLNYPAGIIN